MSVDLPIEGIVDIRMPIIGDSFTWEATEPTAAKKSIVIHATASQAPNEDGFSMAEYHVNHNGWGGIGVHFVITKDSYAGRPGQTPPGSQIQYVGDLGTWRAHCLNQNPGRVGIEISGLFTNGNGVPSEAQLRNARKLIDFMLAPNNILPSLNYYNQVTYHNAVPGQNTSCPGWDNPQFSEWFAYLQGGAEPSWFAKPVVVPVTPAAPEPPEYEKTYKDDPSVQLTKQDAFAHDMTGAGAPVSVAKGTSIDIAGSFTDNGVEYVRTVYSRDHGKWYGLPFEAFQEAPTGQVPDAPVPVQVVETPPVSVLADQTVGNQTDITPPPKRTLNLADALWSILGLLLRPFGKLLKRTK